MNHLLSMISLIIMTFAYSPKETHYSLHRHGIRDSSSNVIVLHYDDGISTRSTLRYLRRSGKSYHYYIDREGTVYKLIDPKYIAYHAGQSEWNGMNQLNDYSIGICFQNNGVEPYTANQYLSGAWLISKLKNRYPDIIEQNIVGHSDVAYPVNRKIDPGKQFEWGLFYSLFESFNNEKQLAKR